MNIKLNLESCFKELRQQALNKVDNALFLHALVGYDVFL